MTTSTIQAQHDYAALVESVLQDGDWDDEHALNVLRNAGKGVADLRIDAGKLAVFLERSEHSRINTENKLAAIFEAARR